MKEDTKNTLADFTSRFMAQEHSMAGNKGIASDIRKLAREIDQDYLQKDSNGDLQALLGKIDTSLELHKHDKGDPDLGNPITDALETIKQSILSESRPGPRP